MSIDSCYESIIGQLNQQGRIINISTKLLTLTNNEDRVSHVYDIIQSLKSFPDVVKVSKCLKVSVHYRNLGNQCFKLRNNFEAWQYYNLALLHAPTESDQYVIALSNRSAVLNNLRMFRECIHDIKEALSRKCPDSLVHKLTKRMVQCEEALSKSHFKGKNSAEGIFTLQGQRNERYMCSSSKVEVAFSESLGRHVVATEHIDVGEVIAQEDPYLTVLKNSQFLFHCSFCLSRNPNLFPCDSCCMSLYCSETCKENALKQYHKVECPLLATLVHMDFTKLELLALRIVIKARTDHVTWTSLIKTVEEAEANINTEFQGLVKIDDKWVYDSKHYKSIHTLSSNVEKRSVSDIFQKSVTAAVLLKFLKNKTNFLNVSKGEDVAKVTKLVGGMLLHHCMTSPTNMHGIDCNIENDAGDFVTDIQIASGAYAFHSLLNHSCCPNVVRSSNAGTGIMTLLCLRPIDKGDQLYDNYGSHYALQDLYNRQQSLKFQYKFTCLCEACRNNWPMYFAMQPAKSLPVSIRREKNELLESGNIDKLQKGDYDTAFKLFKPLCALAQELDPYTPCREMADCQESLKQCLAIFPGLIPFGYSKLIKWEAIPPKC